MPKIATFLWFDDQAEAAVRFYTSVFTNSKKGPVARYGEAGPGKPGTVMTAAFELEGQQFVALNGGPAFAFNEAISFVVNCETQEEIDYYWKRLSDGGKQIECGWLKDQFGLAWQIVPRCLPDLVGGSDPAGSQRAMAAMLKMRKMDIAALKEAYAGA